MGGLFLIGLSIVLLAKLWPLLAAAVVAFAAWQLMFVPARAARAREDRDRLRHARARQEIDEIATATAQAMVEAAKRGRS